MAGEAFVVKLIIKHNILHDNTAVWGDMLGF